MSNVIASMQAPIRLSDGNWRYLADHRRHHSIQACGCPGGALHDADMAVYIAKRQRQ